MATLINEYSFPILLGIMAVSLALALPIRRLRVRFLAVAGILTLLLGSYAFLRPGDSSVATVAEADAMLVAAGSEGRATFVEFFSNTCSQCIAAEPAVSSLMEELRGSAALMRINVQDAVGGVMTRRYRVTATPTYMVISKTGDVVYRKSYGFPDKDAIRSAVNGPAADS